MIAYNRCSFAPLSPLHIRLSIHLNGGGLVCQKLITRYFAYQVLGFRKQVEERGGEGDGSWTEVTSLRYETMRTYNLVEILSRLLRSRSGSGSGSWLSLGPSRGVWSSMLTLSAISSCRLASAARVGCTWCRHSSPSYSF